jgi:hypothetical protein
MAESDADHTQGGESGTAQDMTSQPGGLTTWQSAGASWGATRAQQRMNDATGKG